MQPTIQSSVYYVYYYIRPRDSKVAKAGTPYYVGKGKGSRCTDKHKNVKVPDDPDRIIRVAENLTNKQAMHMEILHINIHGRLDLGNGILRNRTKGGDGCGEPSEQTRQLIGHSLGHSWWNNGTRCTQSLECPGEGWIKGKIKTPKVIQATIKAQQAASAKISGTNWWTNGQVSVRADISPGPEWIQGVHYDVWNKGKKGHLHWWYNGSSYVQSADQPGPEWTLGSPLKGKPRSRATGQSNHKGTCWWTNGTERRRAASCPGEGWVKGTGKVTSGSKGLKWWTNGLESKLSTMSPGHGWMPGRTFTQT